MAGQFTYFMTRRSMVDGVRFWGEIPVGKYTVIMRVVERDEVYTVLSRARTVLYSGDSQQVFEWLAERVHEED